MNLNIIYMYMYSMYSIFLSILLFMISIYLKFYSLNIFMEWMMMIVNSSNIEIMIFIDWISTIYISTILFISSMIMLYSSIYMKNNYSMNKFSWLVITFILSMILMILMPNLFMMIIGWDLLGLISFCLILFYQNFNSFNSGMITILMNRIGDISLILIISILSFNSQWNLFLYFNFNNSYILIMILMMICSMTKSAQFPFSSWLPKAMAAPTPISALVHSSTLVTAGIYIIMRFNKILNFYNLNNFLIFISSLTMFMAGMNALLEWDFKKIIAMSTLSQLSFMLIILSFNKMTLTFFHLLTHAIFKSLLFMCAGSMIHNMSNSQDIRTYGNFSMISPWTNLIFSFSMFSLCGLMFLSGFYSKDSIIENIYMLKSNILFISTFLLSTIMTFCYSFRMIYIINFQTPNLYSLMNFHNNIIMNYSMIFSFILTISFGSILSWIFFDKENLIFITKNMKMILILMIPLSFFINSKLIIFKKKLNFFNNMWFIDFMMKKIFINKFFLFKFMFINLEKGWIEQFPINLKNNFYFFYKLYNLNSIFISLMIILIIMLI